MLIYKHEYMKLTSSTYTVHTYVLTYIRATTQGVIICLGVMNTAIASACARLAGQDQVGGLYGIMESMENLG